MQLERKQDNQNAVNLAVDLVIFLIFLVAEAPRSSGLPAHEWLGIAIGAANLFILLVGLHVALHWQWLVNLLRRSRGTPEGARRIL